MSEGMRLAAVPLILAFLVFMLREMGFRGAKPIAVVGITLLALAAAGRIGRLFEGLNFGGISETAGELTGAALKVVGVGYVFGFTADVCRDMGESCIASWVLAVGRVEILLLAMPYILRALELAGGMIE